VPLRVDGVEADLMVRSVWQPVPSVGAAVAGVAIGVAIVVAAVLLSAGPMALGILTIVLAGLATALGATAYLSVPPETGPSYALWVPPMVAALLAVPVVLGSRAGPLRRWAGMLAMLAAAQLVVWAFLQWDWVWRAVLPTSAPFWAHRLITSLVLVAGVGLVVLIARAQIVAARAGVQGASSRTSTS
jgi:hypothetical protein